MRLVKYHTTWCGPCKRFAPIAQKVAKDLGIELEEIDITDGPIDGVMSVPTTRIYDDNNEIVAEQLGAMSAIAFTRWLNENYK